MKRNFSELSRHSSPACRSGRLLPLFDKYGRLSAKLDKQLVEDFREKLAREGILYSHWLRARILEFLER